MCCPEHEKLVMFADDELPAALRDGVGQHVLSCSSCLAFVEEMRALDRLGRSSLQAIKVPTSARPALRRPLHRRRPVAIATAAVLLLSIMAATWLVMKAGMEPAVEVAGPPVPMQRAPTTPEGDQPAPPLLDEEFERWAAEHREKRIPLIPMEEVVNYSPPEVLPVAPEAIKVDLQS